MRKKKYVLETCKPIFHGSKLVHIIEIKTKRIKEKQKKEIRKKKKVKVVCFIYISVLSEKKEIRRSK